MPASSSWPLSNTNEANTNVSFVPSSILNAVDELTRFIKDDLPDKPNKGNEDTFLPPGLLIFFERIGKILDELTMFMKEDEIKPIGMRERRRKNECEKLYYLKALKGIYTPQKSEAEVPSNKVATTLINKTVALSTKAIKSKVGISKQSNNISAVSYNLLSDWTPKAIESKDESTNNVVRDLNFDRDNPSLSDLPSNVLKPSLELKVFSYNVLSDRTPISIKSSPSSYNLLSDRTPKAIKSKVKSTNIRRVPSGSAYLFYQM
jgi:hypothetical protein